jgi:hypothetical protein
VIRQHTTNVSSPVRAKAEIASRLSHRGCGGAQCTTTYALLGSSCACECARPRSLSNLRKLRRRIPLQIVGVTRAAESIGAEDESGRGAAAATGGERPRVGGGERGCGGVGRRRGGCGAGGGGHGRVWKSNTEVLYIYPSIYPLIYTYL